MTDSRNLRVLDAAEDLAATVMLCMRQVDASRAPGVRGQLLRAIAAVPANIAEASNLGTDPNFRRQLRLSLASANESASHIRLLRRTGALAPAAADLCLNKLSVVCRMLVRLIRAIDEREAYRYDAIRYPKPPSSTFSPPKLPQPELPPPKLPHPELPHPKLPQPELPHPELP
jgi:four helix bundle protein